MLVEYYYMFAYVCHDQLYIQYLGIKDIIAETNLT